MKITWWDIIKEGGPVAFGGHGTGNQSALFNIKYGGKKNGKKRYKKKPKSRKD